MRAMAATGLACLVALAPPAGGVEREPVRHGAEIRWEAVGPGGAGYTSLAPHRGAILRDGRPLAAAAREVTNSAVYDGFPVEGPHILVEGADIAGGLDIYVKRPVVVLGSVVRPRADALFAIHVRPGAGPLYLLSSEAGGAAGARVEMGVLLRSRGAVIHRSRISGVLDGLRLTAGGHRIIETLIDELVSRPGDHNDAIQTSPEADAITIERCRVMNANPQTSAILIRGRDIAIRDSYLAGGGWTLYGGAGGNGHGGIGSAAISVTGTVFGTDFFETSGRFGPVTYWPRDPGSVWRDNTLSSGAPVAPENE